LSARPSRWQTEAQVIAGGVLEILPLGSKIFFGGDNAEVAEAQLDLLEGGATLVRQFGKSPAQVLRRQFHRAADFPATPEGAFCVFSHDLHNVLR